MTSRGELPSLSYHDLGRCSRGATKVVAPFAPFPQTAALRFSRLVALRKGEGRSVKVIRQKFSSAGKNCSGVFIPASEWACGEGGKRDRCARRMTRMTSAAEVERTSRALEHETLLVELRGIHAAPALPLRQRVLH